MIVNYLPTINLASYVMADKRRKTRRRFLQGAGAAGAIGITGLSGCLGGSSSSDSTSAGGSGTTADKITFYNSGSLEYDPGTKENIKRFEEETGITVEVNGIPWTNLKTKLTTAWRSNSDKIDVFNGPTWWLADFVAQDYVAPLNLSDDHMGLYPENLQELVTIDGNAYMAPQLGKWGTYLYDQQALSSASVSGPADTWEEVITKGQTLAENGSGFGFTWGNKDIFTFKQFLYQAGGQMFNENDEPVFAEEGLDAMEFFIELREKDVLPDGIANMGESGVSDNFISGEFATVEGWTPLGSRALNEWEEGRLGSAKPPKGPGDSRATFQDSNAIGVSAYSSKKDAAREFARFMSTQESSKTDMLVEGNPAVVPAVYDDSEIREKYPETLLEDMKYNLLHANSETYVAQPKVDDLLSEQITPAFLGNKDPKQALQTAQQNIRDLYEQAGVL